MDTELYIGTFTGRGMSKGIYRVALRDDGKFTAPELLCRADEPSYLALDATGTRLYAVEERQTDGGVNSFERRAGGWVHTGYASSRGGSPCHLALSPDGRELAVANYMDGVVAVCALEGGALTGDVTSFPGRGGSVNPERQECAHAHQCHFADGLLLVNDLGGDTVRAFEQRDGAWAEREPLIHLPGGAGPRHSVLRGDMMYVLGELDSRLHVYRRGADGWSYAAMIPLTPADRAGRLAPGMDNSGAGALRLSPDGRRLICTTRQDDRVCLLALDDAGMPRFVSSFDCGGRNPRDVQFVGGYIVSACQDGGGLVSLAADPDGTARVVDSAPVPTPVCILNIDMERK